MKIAEYREVEAGTGEVKEGYPEECYSQIMAFLGYGFCKSHAISYSVYSAVDLYLKAHYLPEFMCANASVTGRAVEKKGVSLLDQRVKYCIGKGLPVRPPDVNTAQASWSIRDGCLVASLENIKGFSRTDCEDVIASRPYATFGDFLKKTRLGNSKIDSLIFAGALDAFDDRESLYNYFHEVHLKKKKDKGDSKQAVFDFMLDEAVETNHTHFTKKELDDRFFDLNGFALTENLVRKYAAELAKGELKTITEAKQKKTNKHFTMLCRIASADAFTSSKGGDFIKLMLDDGTDSTEIVLRKINYNAFRRSLAVGNVIRLPCVQAEGESIYIDDLNKRPVMVMEKA